MTTTLPAPATSTLSGVRVGASAGLRVAADRLAAMPRSWTPSIGELLAEESRRHDTDRHETEPPQSSTDRPPLTGRPTLAHLDRVLDALAANDTQVAALHAERAVLLARAAGLAEALETDLLDHDDPTARRAPSARRLELAHRALTAEIATALRIGEHTAGTLTDHAVTLSSKAPATLAALHEGRLSWGHATAITTHLTDLSPEESAAVERSVLATILDRDTGLVTCTPTQTGRRARRARETAHPTPADVRHAEATQHRAVWLDDGHDGMAWLTAHLPAPLAHAAYDRLTRTAGHLATSSGSNGSRSGSVVSSGERRTLAQARADALAALLLDDGTLDHSVPTSTDPGDERDETHDPDEALGVEPVTALLHTRSTLATLARSIRPQLTVTVPVLTLLGLTDAPATMNGHVPIDPDTARRLTALAPSLRRVLTDPETGTVLSVGRTAYAVPADLKALVRARDTTCRFPGCTHPATQSDLDHTQAWAGGGATTATNLAALCRRHHTMKHQTAWQVTQRQTTGWGGTLEWTSPTGRRYETRAELVETTRHRHPPRGHEPLGQGLDDPVDMARDMPHDHQHDRPDHWRAGDPPF
ncbi:DUF222 domain-containing protein [Isoptericola sp. NPDC019571]|uniref:HNH endonuclease signature motif containing protein n=1 Tax=Isoptericola sp. NPDC019571 TaxID=3364008 RepID=UPI0037A5B63D